MAELDGRIVAGQAFGNGEAVHHADMLPKAPGDVEGAA
jgi:hypothetical protein